MYARWFRTDVVSGDGVCIRLHYRRRPPSKNEEGGHSDASPYAKVFHMCWWQWPSTMKASHRCKTACMQQRTYWFRKTTAAWRHRCGSLWRRFVTSPSYIYVTFFSLTGGVRAGWSWSLSQKPISFWCQTPGRPAAGGYKSEGRNGLTEGSRTLTLITLF